MGLIINNMIPNIHIKILIGAGIIDSRNVR